MLLSVLAKDQLIPGRWYVGRGRNSNVALWDGENFLTVAYKGEYPDVKIEPYYEADSGCFQPFLLVPEGQMIAPFGQSGWAAHYGSALVLDLPTNLPADRTRGKADIYWRRSLLFAKLLARLETGRANRRDMRVTHRLLEDK